MAIDSERRGDAVARGAASPEVTTDMMLESLSFAKVLVGVAIVAAAIVATRARAVPGWLWVVLVVAAVMAEDIAFEMIARRVARRRGRGNLRRVGEVARRKLEFYLRPTVWVIFNAAGFRFCPALALSMATILSVTGALDLARRRFASRHDRR